MMPSLTIVKLDDGVTPGALTGFVAAFAAFLIYPRDSANWSMLCGFVLGASPFAAFAYYRMQKSGTQKFHATQRTISEIERLEDVDFWFIGVYNHKSNGR